MKKKNCK